MLTAALLVHLTVGTLKTGFHSMARDHVSKVKVAEGGGVTAPSRTVAANKTSANGTAAVAVVARNAPASEVGVEPYLSLVDGLTWCRKFGCKSKNLGAKILAV